MTLHTINFTADINAASFSALQNVAMQAVSAQATEIKIFLSSSGGSNDVGFAAYHFLRSLPVKLSAHCIGNIESMAIIMYLAADVRIAVPHAKFKIHPLHWGFPQGNIDHDRLIEFGDSLNFDAERYIAIFEERTQAAQKKLDVRNHLMGQARLLGAAAAVEVGLATAIADATIPTDSIKWWV